MICENASIWESVMYKYRLTYLLDKPSRVLGLWQGSLNLFILDERSD